MAEKKKGSERAGVLPRAGKIFELSESGLVVVILLLPLFLGLVIPLIWVTVLVAAIRTSSVKDKRKKKRLGVAIGVTSFLGAVLLSRAYPSGPFPDVFVGLGFLACSIGVWLGPMVALKKSK